MPTHTEAERKKNKGSSHKGSSHKVSSHNRKGAAKPLKKSIAEGLNKAGLAMKLKKMKEK